MVTIEEIKKKRQILMTAAKNLKKHFVGIDEIIDEVISNIEVWFIMPELLTRPVVVNLWGMTGVGKTDLIRRLIRELNFEKAYIEVQLDSGKSSSSWGRDSIKYHIKNGGLTPEEQGIVFLDEIQRFRSIDENENMLDNDKFQDIWMLLSDGQFSDYGNQKQELELILLEFEYSQDYEEYDDEIPESKSDSNLKEAAEVPTTKESKKPKRKRRFQSSLWAAKQFKDELEIDMSLEDIMLLDSSAKMQLVHDKINNISMTNKVRKYSKLLIFISGNLDEAYSMSDSVSEVNVDADILHEFSKKINILNIKDSLLKKFKPEQIARFGNTHIIYPSLSKSSFKKLISRYLCDISQKTLETCNVSVSFDESVHLAVYRNGVYPTQGTRPLFSTISSLIENPLPTFLFEALLLKKNVISLSVDEDGHTLNALIDGKIFKKKINLQLDKISRNTSPDKLALVAVHESAHAVAYALLLQLAPSQIVSDSSDSVSNGFVIPHELQVCKDLYLTKIQILLAGGIGEEIVFTKKNKTDGLFKDIEKATGIAATMIRQLNMDGTIGCMLSSGLNESHSYITNVEQTNGKVEQILKEQHANVTELLHNNMEFFKKVIATVLKKRRLLPEEFYEIAKEFVPGITIQESSFVKTYEYASAAETFLRSKSIIAKKK